MIFFNLYLLYESDTLFCMTTYDEVAQFLADFKVKLSLWNIIYRNDRGKNTQALLDLELTPNQRTEIIKRIEVADIAKALWMIF